MNRIPPGALALAGCLAAAAAGCGRAAPAAPLSASAGQPLRVMSYNIHHGAGNDDCDAPPAAPGAHPNADCGLSLERIAAVIRAENVDIAGLQEVDRFWARSGGVDQAAALGALLGMETCYGANLTHGADTHASVPHEYGTLVVSRFAIASCNNALLPRAGAATEQRGLLKAGIRAHSVLIDFYNTHLHTLEADRRLQVDTIVERIGAPPGPAILVGDLNARPSEPYLTPLFNVLADVWPVAGSGSGFTSPASPQEPAGNRIDYVLISRGITAGSAFVRATADTALASDHYPVVVTLSVGSVRAVSARRRQLHD